MADKETIEVLKKVFESAEANEWRIDTDATSDGEFEKMEPFTFEEMIACVDAVDIVTIRASKAGAYMGAVAVSCCNDGIEQIIDYTVDNAIAEILNAELAKY